MSNGWDESVYVIHKANKMMAVGRTQRLILMGDPKRERDIHICNLSRPDGLVCRLPRGHDGDHIPFTGEHISTTGVYVASVMPLERA